MTTETPSIPRADRYLGAPLVYRSAELLFVIRPSAWTGREEEAVQRLLMEWFLSCGGADGVEFPCATSFTKAVVDTLSSFAAIPERNILYRFDGKVFSELGDIDDLSALVGYRHRYARTGIGQKSVSLVLSQNALPVLADDHDLDDGCRVRVSDVGLHAAGDPVSVQAACALEGALAAGFTMSADDPLIAHVTAIEARIRSLACCQRPACIDFECLQAIHGGLLAGAPSGAFLAVVFAAWQALDLVVSRDVGVFRVSEALGVPISRFLPGTPADHQDWAEWSGRLGFRSFPVSRGLCLHGESGTASEVAVREAVRRHPSIDGVLLPDGTLELRSVAEAAVIVRDDHKGVRIVVGPTL